MKTMYVSYRPLAACATGLCAIVLTATERQLDESGVNPLPQGIRMCSAALPMVPYAFHGPSHPYARRIFARLQARQQVEADIARFVFAYVPNYGWADGRKELASPRTIMACPERN